MEKVVKPQVQGGLAKIRIGVSYSCNVTKYEIKRTQFGEEIKIELASDNVTVDTSTAI